MGIKNKNRQGKRNYSTIQVSAILQCSDPTIAIYRLARRFSNNPTKFYSYHAEQAITKGREYATDTDES
ncbi:hypothetical protein PMIT1323_00328 [Prochlorococcus marinus str. MIT 1323]|nr:hypothetical protein PMIT1323_00328 [Prochlorococcus marinus str. MIT 1323]